MIVRILSLLIAFVAAMPLAAQTEQAASEGRRSRTSGVDYFTTNIGVFGVDMAQYRGAFVYPRGDNGVNYMYGSGLWFGARKNVQGERVDISFITYDPSGDGVWARPGSWTSKSPPTNTYINHLGYSSEFDRSSGIYTGPGAARPAWPLWSDGPSVPTLAHPGRYIVDSAARTGAVSGAPAFVPGVAEQFVSRYHDGYTDGYFLDSVAGHPIRLQFEQSTYSFTQPDLDNTVILHYQIINVGVDTLFDCHVGQATDPDLGLDAANDHTDFYHARPELATAIAWSETETRNPGTLLMTLLESPAIESDSDSPRHGYIRHDKRDYDSTEQVGVSSFRSWTPTNTVDRTAGERYRFMATSDLDAGIGPLDVRALLVAGRFDMLPGDTARFAIAFTVLADVGDFSGGSDDRIETAAERVIALYRAGSTSSVPMRSAPSSGLSISGLHPNPASSHLAVDLSLHLPAATSIRVVDALGQVVLAHEPRMMDAGEQRVGLDLSGVAPGVYMIVVESAGSVTSRAIVVGR